MPSGPPRFEILTPLTDVETMAIGRAIRERRRLVKAYGSGRWRKRKGWAWIRLSDGGIGRREFKLKRFRD